MGVSWFCSWVDKLWSIAPIYYAWTIARRELEQGEWYPRATIAFLLVCIWGIRLSYNFWRKGGYAWDGEDYRWPIVKKSMNPFVFFVFHLVFIAFMQNLLLASLLAPIYACWKFGEENGHVPSFNVLDVLGIILASGFLIIEAVADQQQWIFHKRKHSRKLTAAEKKKGFLTTGLWKYSRHPNFFAEQAFWWSQCVFAAAGCGKWLGWWLVAPLCLTLLFQGSTGLTEDISSSKYPLYAEYQRTTPRLIPFFKL